MARLRYNGVRAALSGSHTNSTTTITLAAALTHSGGTNVPTITGSDYIPLSIHDSNGVLKEVVWLTAYTAGATTGTIARGKEGTSGSAHDSGAIVVVAPLVADLSPYKLDPVAVNATYGDHFTGSDIDTGKWSRAGSYVASDDVGDSDTVLSINPCRSPGSYYYQTAPAGDWTLVAKFYVYMDAVGTCMFGLLATNNSGDGVGAGFYNNAPNSPLVGNVVAGAYTSTFQNAEGPLGSTAFGGGPMWLKMVKSGTSYSVAGSVNGHKWGPISPAHTNSATITRIGFGQFFSDPVDAFDIDFFDVQ